MMLMVPVLGQEAARRDFVGSYRDAQRELQGVSSVELMRESILRSISSSIINNQKICNHREEIPHLSQPNIEVKFLEKRSSSFSSPKSQPEEIKLPEPNPQRESLEKKESKQSPLPDFEISGTFEASGELFKEKDNAKRQEDLGSINDDASKPKNSGRNCLKLAIRSKSDGIFEDCSTYNISCPDATPEFKNYEIFTNSIAGYSFNADLETSSETNYTCTDSELSSSNSLNSPDEQTSLCDTFFTHLDNNDGGQLLKDQFRNPRSASSLTPEQARSNSLIAREDGVEKSEDVAGVSKSHDGGRRNSKKVRRRQRKNHSRNPLTYDCPKCGVSYVIASKMSNDGVCFNCDMWTSVEPEFVKREKLMTWNTCRIC